MLATALGVVRSLARGVIVRVRLTVTVLDIVRGLARAVIVLPLTGAVDIDRVMRDVARAVIVPVRLGVTVLVVRGVGVVVPVTVLRRHLTCSAAKLPAPDSHLASGHARQETAAQAIVVGTLPRPMPIGSPTPRPSGRPLPAVVAAASASRWVSSLVPSSRSVSSSSSSLGTST